MASQYNVEPQPTAKVILNTTAGDLTLELFAKQTPLASRNFLQHCLDGYYNNTIFHRLVSGFIIQGGDPTGSGSGGISSVNNGDPFDDEFHSRLKFNRRGLLGMANEGKDSNGSQFFLTLAATPELQGKNTMFGRIEGDTIFNLVKMADAELADDSERPLYPTRITGAEIILNPFTDMVARAKEAPRTSSSAKDKSAKKRKKPAGKSGLSFGLDEDEEQVAAPVTKKLKVNPKMVAAADDQPAQPEQEAVQKPTKPAKASRRSPSPEPVSAPRPAKQPSRTTAAKSQPQADESDDEIEDDTNTASRQAALERTNAEIAALKASMRRSNITETKPQEKPKSLLESMIPATSIRARKRGKAQDDKGALDMFNAFKQRLNNLPATSDLTNGSDRDRVVRPVDDTAETNGEPDDEAELCDLHFIANCQSCKSWDEQKPDDEAEADGDDPGWMSHRLTFAKDSLGKDLEWKKKMEEIEVIDPREKARLIKEQKRKHKSADKK